MKILDSRHSNLTKIPQSSEPLFFKFVYPPTFSNKCLEIRYCPGETAIFEKQKNLISERYVALS